MKKRLDLILTERKFYKSREKSKEAITSSRVFVNGILVTKPSMEFDENCEINALPFEFVSRGGFKLQKAIEEFKIDLKDKVVMDRILALQLVVSLMYACKMAQKKFMQ